uniref:Uncharacterized protein n=1 Tax=Panagrellus redivivus TaxID=6233 RepID=A0A7E4VMB2_PANRE
MMALNRFMAIVIWPLHKDNKKWIFFLINIVIVTFGIKAIEVARKGHRLLQSFFPLRSSVSSEFRFITQTCCKCCQPVCAPACINGGGCACGCNRGGCRRKRDLFDAINAYEAGRAVAATDLLE